MRARSMTFPYLWRVVFVSLIIITFSCGGGGGSGSKNSASDDDDNQLEEIEPRDDTIRPFGRSRFVPLSRQMEYVQIGSAYNGDSANNLFIIDPLEYNFNGDGSQPTVPPGADDRLASLSEDKFAATYQKVAANGILDDDLQDEVAVVSWDTTGPGALRIINPGGELDATEFDIDSVSIALDIDGRTDLAYDYDITTGDVDGDGYDEIIIVGSQGGDDLDERIAQLWIVDDCVAGNDLMDSKTVLGPIRWDVHLGVDQIKVAAGNLDQDYADEITIAFAAISKIIYPGKDGVHFTVYDDKSTDFSEVHTGQSQLKMDQLNIPGTIKEYFNIAMGDLDQDGRDEIALAVRSMGFFVTIDVFDDAVGEDNDSGDANDAHALLDDALHIISASTGAAGAFKFFDALNIDADWADELFVGDTILDDVRRSNDEPLFYIPDFEDGIIKLSPTEEIRWICFGDVNGDLREDITILYADAIIETIGVEEVTTYDSETNEVDTVEFFWRGGRTDTDSPSPPLDQRGTVSGDIGNSIIAAANVDNDSTILEYAPDNPDATPEEIAAAHTTYYSRNQIIALLATPPTINDISVEGASSVLGQSSGQTGTIGAEFSVRAGALWGFEEEISAGVVVSTKIGSVEAEIQAGIEVSVYGSTSTSVTKTVTYAAGQKNDRIIFSTTPYDSYTYTIISHPDPEQIGKPFYIDLPQRPKILSWTKAYYNDHNGDQMDIGSEILQHTPGKINTYPDWNEKEDILSQNQDPGPDPVPLIDDGLWWLFSKITKLGESDQHVAPLGNEAEEVTGTSLELTTEHTVGGSITGSVDVTAKGCVKFYCQGNFYGYSIGAFMDYTWTESTLFEATVPPIPADQWESNYYEWGMFSYIQTLTDEETKITHEFVVLNYWVD